MSPHEEYNATMAQATAEAYDAEARATEYLGPDIAFGLVYEYTQPGQLLLDLGIGTGLASALFRKAGLRVYGMDISQEMLDACRWKGFKDLTRHDLTDPPYPYASESFDHILCLGVLNFLSDPSSVFSESSRLLKARGIFAFVLGTRGEEDDPTLLVGPEHTGTGESVTLHLYSDTQTTRLLDEWNFALLKSLPFPVYMDAEKSTSLPAACYVARKRATDLQS